MRLPVRTRGPEQIGGPFPHTPLLHHRTSFDGRSCLGRPFAAWTPVALLARLRFLRVRWIATATADAGRFIAGVPGVSERWREDPLVLWELPEEPALFGIDATYNEIRARLPVGSPVTVLPYHWIDGLRAQPENVIVPVLRYDDPVPFICVRRVGVTPVVIRY